MSAERRVRVAIAGLGGIGPMHAANVRQQDGAELVAVASGTPERAAEVAAQFGPGVRPCSYEQLAAADDVDAVVVCSRSRDHAKHAVPLLDAGKHVLLEKPGATSLADHDRIGAAAAGADGTVLHVAYMRRFDSLFVQAHRLVRAGAIGQPLVVLTISRDMEYLPAEKPSDTGGFLLDMSVHDYDTACWMLGQRPREVTAARQALVYPQLLDLGDLDNGVITVSFDGGGIATTHVSRTCAFGHDVRCEILGAEGSIFVGNGAGGSGVTVLDARNSHDFPGDYQVRFRDSYRAELAHFISACAAGATGADPGADEAAATDSTVTAATLQDDRMAVEIGVAARASAVSDRPLSVGEDYPWHGAQP
jgi:myo-inositol 2-dehydrogenase/D-chiro-inositol 1-dehydrogenase